MVFRFRRIAFFLVLVLISGFVSAIADPSMLYCQKLGYTYQIDKSSDGEQGYCIVNSTKYDSWEFFNGKVGKEYSYCAKNGYDTQTGPVPDNPFGFEQAFCAPINDVVRASSIVTESDKISVVDLMAANGDDLLGSTTSSLSASGVALPAGISASSVPSSGSIPSSFDWRNKDGKNWMTPVKDQGACGSCWAFGTLGAIEAKFNIDNNNPLLLYDLSEQDLVSCSGGGDCAGGNSFLALEYINSTGIVDESCFRYSANNAKCSRCADWQNRTAKIRGYNVVYGDTNELKAALMAYGPMVAAIDAYDIGYPRIYAWHMVTLVGWNDAGGYWIVKNSWGTGWQDKGYGKMPYGKSMETYGYAIGIGPTVHPIQPHYVPEFGLLGAVVILAAGLLLVIWRRK